MAFTRAPKAAPRSLIASVSKVAFDEPIWNKYLAGTDSAWQAELWRLYDCVPEFSRGANWVGQACSRVRLTVNAVDSRGQVQKEVPEKDPVGRLAYGVLGGPQRRADLLRLMGINMIVPGEFWILGLSVVDDDKDKWFIVGFNELQRIEDFLGHPDGMPREQFVYDTGKNRYILQEGRDIIARVWTPHPFRTWAADSAGRSLQMVLVELEILTQYILAQARSRIASGGVWIWPTGADFATKDSQPVTGESLMQRMLDAGEANLKSFGGASQVMPMIVEMPKDVFDKIKEPIMFGSELSKEAMQIRSELRQRVAGGLSVEPEIITGAGDVSHWNGPEIAVATVNNVIVPIMVQICDALTDLYLKPALKRAGKDPRKYKFWFDTASLVTRPQRLKETLEMYTQGLVGWEEVLRAADLPDSAHMSDDEREQVIAQKLLLSDPNMVLIPEIREKAGLNIKSVVPDGQPIGQTGQGVAGRPPAPPPPARTLKATAPPSQPDRSTLPGAPNNAVPGNQNKQAITAAANQLALVVGTDAVVRQTLERVGKALLRGHPRSNVDFGEVYLADGHHVDGESHARALVASGFGTLPNVLEYLGRESEAPQIRAVLTEYCVDRLVAGERHEPRIMRGYLEREGLL